MWVSFSFLFCGTFNTSQREGELDPRPLLWKGQVITIQHNAAWWWTQGIFKSSVRDHMNLFQLTFANFGEGIPDTCMLEFSKASFTCQIPATPEVHICLFCCFLSAWELLSSPWQQYRKSPIILHHSAAQTYKTNTINCFQTERYQSHGSKILRALDYCCFLRLIGAKQILRWYLAFNIKAGIPSQFYFSIAMEPKQAYICITFYTDSVIIISIFLLKDYLIYYNPPTNSKIYTAYSYIQNAKTVSTLKVIRLHGSYIPKQLSYINRIADNAGILITFPECLQRLVPMFTSTKTPR